MQARILIVEDDPAILELLHFHLDNEGFATLTAADGREALAVFARNHPDLVLLDLMLPGMNGLEVCRRIRGSSDTPIIILTAKGQEDDRIRGLESGADDYVTKPFSPRELVARIHAVLRRSHFNEEEAALSFGDLYLDRKRHRVLVGEREIELTPKEYDLLALLMSHRGEAIDRETLLERVWGYNSAGGTRTLDVHIRRIRQKIGDDPQAPRFIETVHGLGYRFKDAPEGDDDD